MNEQDRQKMKDANKRASEMNLSLLGELENLLNENKKLEEENKKWREYYESGSNLYKRSQGNQGRGTLNT
ncbi:MULTISPECIES: hypothetical protein [Bacillaceae]|uniref:BZIP domain-containing protein n=1 Tax=Oceanobacillus caeni TaxID=405946 RepID=A0ABR5MHR4_9BACI|nr:MULTISPECIES: hypothetical protein [Bacillaceae]KPH73229.1 hypothetical protein AFL42_12910 [Oceanobacillus caeni]MBU8791184.1 hypothetical protein [Oceanobacillus caeni]MED4475932.1 hypothetical protein [Oceanobacillus caeni]